MHINQDNYEQYFLDHAEGNLSPEMERELADFLEANPDLKSILEDFDPSPLQTVESNNKILKKRLKKQLYLTDNIREDNVDEWMIREIEGILNEADLIELKEFLSLNPAYNFDHKLFRQTIFTPDLSTSFPKKNELKKKGTLLPVSSLAWLLPAAAAVILLFIGIRFFRQTEVSTMAPVQYPVAVIPEMEPPQMKEPTGGTPSPGTPSRVRTYSFRLKPIADQPVILSDHSETWVINLATFDLPPVLTTEIKEKPLIAKVFNNMIAKARDGFSKKTNLDQINQRDLNFWAIAKAGIDGYNSLSDRDIELYVRKDNDGNVTSYALIDHQQLLWSKELNRD